MKRYIAIILLWLSMIPPCGCADATESAVSPWEVAEPTYTVSVPPEPTQEPVEEPERAWREFVATHARHGIVIDDLGGEGLGAPRPGPLSIISLRTSRPDGSKFVATFDNKTVVELVSETNRVSFWFGAHNRDTMIRVEEADGAL